VNSKAYAGNLPLAAVEREFHTGTVVLHYEEGPDNGPPLVLLHGLARNCADFELLIPQLSQEWHVFAVDLRGHGKSGHVHRGYSSEGYAGDVAALVEEVINKPTILFGHSLGGVAATCVAASQPERVRALILGDSALTARAFPCGLYPALFEALLRLRVAGGTVEQMAKGLAQVRIPLPGIDERIAIGDLPGNDEAYLMKWAACLQQVDPGALEMTLDGSTWGDYDGEKLMAKISCPTLLLQANPELGGLMSDEELERATQLLAKPKVEKFPLLGHALHLQQPQPVLKAITNFLKELRNSQIGAK
jgi:pimeloyl-ACP methyl ester carboxylesterase